MDHLIQSSRLKIVLINKKKYFSPNRFYYSREAQRENVGNRNSLLPLSCKMKLTMIPIADGALAVTSKDLENRQGKMEFSGTEIIIIIYSFRVSHISVS